MRDYLRGSRIVQCCVQWSEMEQQTVIKVTGRWYRRGWKVSSRRVGKRFVIFFTD